MNDGSENPEGKKERPVDHVEIDAALLGAPDGGDGARRHWFRWAWIGLGLLLVLGAGVAIWPTVRPEIEHLIPSFGGGGGASGGFESQASARLDALDQRLGAVESTVQALPIPPDLESRLSADRRAVAALRKQVAALQVQVAASAAVAARLSSVEQKLDALQKSGAGPANSAALDEVNKKLNTLSQTIDVQNGTISHLQQEVSQVGALAPVVRAAPKHIALVLAVVDLEQASQRSAAFPDALKSVLALSGQSPPDALKVLGTYAPTGVPSIAKLRREFPKVADRIVDAGREPPGSWWQKVFAQLSGLVTVRRVGEVEGSTPGDIVARAEVRLQDNDLEGAVKTVGELSGASALVANGWLKQAKARLAVDGAVAAVRAETFGALAKAAATP